MTLREISKRYGESVVVPQIAGTAVVPELQNRGLFRSAYSGETLRANFKD